MALRSVQSNKYMWSLVDKLGEARHMDYMDVYNELIHKYGSFIWVLIPEKDVDDFLAQWAVHGSGWYAERIKPKSNGIACRVYKGTSMYSAEEMNRFLSHIQEECKSYGIETMTPAQLQELIGVQP